MTASLEKKAYDAGKVLYMALELSAQRWRIAFSDGSKRRQVTVEANDLAALEEQIRKAKERFGLGEGARVVSCYEAGRDGFWIHRELERRGIENQVVDAASIEVPRRARRAKTDRLDVALLLDKLIRYLQGEHRVWRVVRVPPPEWEDLRNLYRERGSLLSEVSRHRSRIRSHLTRYGVRLKLDSKFLAPLEAARQPNGEPLPEHLVAGVRREWERLSLVKEQLREVSRRMQGLLKDAPMLEPARLLKLVRGIGQIGAWTLVVEVFGWREIGNRRELSSLVGLVPTPYNSGSMVREQGISKAGNRRVRALLIQLAWLWLRHQPQSKHSQWFQERFAGGGARQRRIGIVALARRLLIDLWRLLDKGVVPDGARLQTS